MKPAVKLIAIFAFCTFWARADQIVVPAAQATQSGNSFLIDPFAAPGTIDSVYGSKNFSGPVSINGIAFRLDEASLGRTFDAVIPRVTIRISTYLGTYNSYLIGPGYNGNKGLDDTLVFDAAVHWTTTDLPSGPNPFDLKVLFSKQFAYDPANGALLVDFTTTGPFSGGIPSVDTQGHGDSSIGWFGDKSLGNLVTQFDVTSIPEPSTLWLMLFGLSAAYFFRATRRTSEHA
jgi:hypothetical protein